MQVSKCLHLHRQTQFPIATDSYLLPSHLITMRMILLVNDRSFSHQSPTHAALPKRPTLWLKARKEKESSIQTSIS
jgi:hypothetical protein